MIENQPPTSEEPETPDLAGTISPAPATAEMTLPRIGPEHGRPTPEAPVLLAIDTCTRRSSVALRDAFTLRAECSWESDRHHTAAVSAQIHRMMHACGIGPAQIGAVAVAIGPGSFTGVRCGLAIAKGMAVARDLPLIGVTTFEVLAAAQPDHKVPVYTVVEAGRQRVAACRYEWQGEKLWTAAPWSIQTWQAFADAIRTPASGQGSESGSQAGTLVWVCGDLSPELAALLNGRVQIAPAPFNLRRAGVLAELGYLQWQKGETDDPYTLMPLYPPELKGT